MIPISSLLHPSSSDQDLDPIAAIEDELRSALDGLEKTGALQSQQRMGIEALLNSPDESGMMEETSDEDICQAVLAIHKAEDGGPSDGDDSDDVEGGAPVEPCPTYSEVFQAISTLNRYTEHVVDPAARKFKEALASFACQVQSTRDQALTTTHITDFFQCT
jgi:hypothetical protein